MNFNELYEITDTFGSHASFNREECEALYNLCTTIPKGGHALEIGVQFGRSLSVMGLVAKERGFDIRAVDNWLEDVSVEAKPFVQEMIMKYDMPVTLLSMDSKEAAGFLDFLKFDLIHIDGDHTYEGVKTDIELWNKRVKKNGYMIFDDYGHDSLPDIYKATQEFFTDNKEWEFVGRYGEKLGVFRKL